MGVVFEIDIEFEIHPIAENMRQLKIILLFVLIVSMLVYLLYGGLRLLSSENMIRCYDNIVQELPQLDERHESISNDLTDVQQLRNAEEIYVALKKLLDEQLSLNTKESLSRVDFQTVVTLSMLLPPINNISRMSTPPPETFLNYIAPTGLPIIFTDMLVGTSLDNWSWDLVRERWGDEVFHNTRQGNYSSRVNRFGKHIIHRVSTKLSDFIDVVTGKREPRENERGLYITKQKILPPSVLEKEFHYPPFYNGVHKKCFLEPTAWIGAPGTFTQGHIDSKDNFVYQLIGKKKWTIFPPHDYKYLYYKQGKGSLEWSAVLSQKEKPDLDKYPLYKLAHPITFVMNPGEVLYLPRGWTHFIENVTPSLMLNTWRRGPAAITEPWIEKNRIEIRSLCIH